MRPLLGVAARGAAVLRAGSDPGGRGQCQAAVYLSSQVAKMWLIIRKPGLTAHMSRYLVERITATPNIEILTGCLGGACCSKACALFAPRQKITSGSTPTCLAFARSVMCARVRSSA